MDTTIQTLATRFLAMRGIESWLTDEANATQKDWPVPGSNGKVLYLHLADTRHAPQAALTLAHVVKDGTPARKVAKRLRVIYAQGNLELVADPDLIDPDPATVAAYALPHTNGRQLRIRATTSLHNVNDGHGAIAWRAAVAYVWSALAQMNPDWTGDEARDEAIKRVQRARYLQHFSLSTITGTKGLLRIVPNDEFEAMFGASHNAVIDAENVKGDVRLVQDVALIKAYLRRPLDKVNAVAIAELAEIGVGHDVRTRIGNQEAFDVAKTLTLRSAYQLAADLEADTQRAPEDDEVPTDDDVEKWPWRTINTSPYAMPDERKLVKPWVGSLYTRTKGRLPSTLGTTKVRGTIRRTQAILSAITAYFVGDGTYYGATPPPHGYVAPVLEDEQVIGWAMAASTLAEVSLPMDTMDADGDFVAVGLRTVPDDPHPFWAQVTRLPTSVGGGCLLKMDEQDWKFLRDERGLMSSPILYDDPYAHFQKDGQYTLVPIPDDTGAEHLSAGKLPAVGALYNLSNVMKILGIMHAPVSETYRRTMREHGVDIPRVDGLRFNLSEHAIDPAGDKDLMVAELERVLWEYVVAGGTIDECWRNRVGESINKLRGERIGELVGNHQGYVNVMNCFVPCSGEHLDYESSIRAIQTRIRSFEKDLDMMANGPLSTLGETINPDLTALIRQMHGDVAGVWTAKRQYCDSLPYDLHWRERQELEFEAFYRAQDQLAALVEFTYTTAYEAGLLPRAGDFSNAVIQGAALDRRRYRDGRATNINHLYTWVRHSAEKRGGNGIGELDFWYYTMSHEDAVPTTLMRLSNISHELVPGARCVIAGDEDHYYVASEDGQMLADIIQLGDEALKRPLIYRGVTADGYSDVFEVASLLKTS